MDLVKSKKYGFISYKPSECVLPSLLRAIELRHSSGKIHVWVYVDKDISKIVQNAFLPVEKFPDRIHPSLIGRITKEEASKFGIHVIEYHSSTHEPNCLAMMHMAEGLDLIGSERVEDPKKLNSFIEVIRGVFEISDRAVESIKSDLAKLAEDVIGIVDE